MMSKSHEVIAYS